MARNRSKKRKKNDGGKNIIFIAVGVVAVALVAVFLLMPGKKHYINDEVGEVRSVVNGNTIELKNGLKVQLLGVESSTKSKDFLSKNLVGQQVRLLADGSNQKPYYTNAEKETVSAYVHTVGASTFSNVNGYMIHEKQAGFLNAYCNDSAKIFAEYAKGGSSSPVSGVTSGSNSYSLLSEIELGKKMTEAS